jgi:curved DNA-binding protein CbpA
MNLLKFWKSYFLDQFTLHLGGGGGGGQTTSTVQNTNVPEYARPYVETMLGATQEQLFQGSRGPDVTNPETGEVTRGDFNITGFKPYQAYGGTYDPVTGKQLSYDPSKGIADINAMQANAYNNVGGMQVPKGEFANANWAIKQAGLGADQSAQQAYIYGQEGAKSGAQGQQLGIAGGAKYGDMGAQYGAQGANLGIAGGAKYGDMGAQYGAQGAGFGKQAAGLADPALAYGARAAGYGDTGAGYGAQAAQLANTALGYGQGSADIGQMALRAQGMGEDISGQSQALARQQAGAGAQYAQMATDPRVTQALMNPYTQNVLDVQNKEMQRQADIARTQRSSQAVRAGAFGGARQAIENAEAQRNLETMKTANTAQALNQAYQQAQAQQQFGANLNLQGLSGAQQGLGTALQGGQLGLSGLGTALQGQQGALAGVGQAGSMYGLGMQGAQTGIQGTQAGLAGVNAANQAYQTGIQGSQAGIAGAGMGLQGVNAQLAGTAQGMQGAQVGLQGVDRQLAGTAQGMQGAQVGLQGVQGAQAGYNLLGQQGMNLTSALGQQQQQELGLYNNQMAMGDKKMAYDQSIKNQAVQDYANAQQYPLMQLGTMSNMLRGLPMQASTTNQYAAAPSAASQAIGTIGAGASIYNAMKPPGGAAGGEVKGYAKGGIMSYDMGGEVESQLENMDEKGLATQAKESSSPSVRRMAQRILRERQMGNKPQGTGPMGVQYQAAQPQMPSYAPGGIVAFAAGDRVYGGPSTEADEGEAEAKIGMQERLAQSAPTTGGIMGATTQPATPIPVAPQINRALQQSSDIPAFMKAEYAEAERRKNAPLSEFMAERQAAMREAGVADTSEGQQKMRAEMMAEKANLGEEKERQRYLRLAEFFASWGSTPGPTLVAGMNALKQAVPGIVSDEKEQKKARREIDKSIADLDNATRLEKRGEVDAAMALKLKAAEDMKALNAKFIDYQSRRESDQSSAAASKYSADMQFRSEQLRSQTSALDRAARRDTDKDTKIFGQWQAASKTEADVLGRIQREENDKQHMADLNAVKLGKQTGTDEDNKFDETKVPTAVLSAMKEAQARIAKREESWKQRIKTAAENTDLAYNRIAIKPEVATRDYTRPTGEPQAGASTRPALTDPSLQRQ